jgi:hypothetical protein
MSLAWREVLPVIGVKTVMEKPANCGVVPF